MPLDLTAALAAAKLCQLAYTDAVATPLGGERAVVRIDGAPGDPSGDIAVAFRGTANTHDAVLDGRFFLRRLSGCPGLVHSGFAAGTLDAYTPLLDLLPVPSPDANPRTIHFAGHSFGAALAALTAYRFLSSVDSYTVGSVYLFGCPRIGEHFWSAGYDRALYDRTFRVVHGEDLIAHLPPPFPFAHVGQLAHVDGHGNVREDMVACSELGLTLGDHHMHLYVQALEAALAAETAAEAARIADGGQSA